MMRFISRLHNSLLARTLMLLTVLVCMVLTQATPAQAKKHSKGGKGNTYGTKVISIESFAKEADSDSSGTDSTKLDWMNGTWVNGCYVNDRGDVMARLSDADREPFLSFKKKKKCNILFIGASQTTRTAYAIKDKNVFFYGMGGATFAWFFVAEHKHRVYYPAYQVIRSFIKLHPHGTVIIDMGGNDIHNVEAYAGFYRDLVNLYPRVKFYFRGVPPRDIGDPKNGKRLEFNRRLESAVPGHVINLFEEIYTFPEFVTVDGAHFSKEETRRIYQLTMDAIGRKVKVNVKNGKVGKSKKK